MSWNEDKKSSSGGEEEHPWQQDDHATTNTTIWKNGRLLAEEKRVDQGLQEKGDREGQAHFLKGKKELICWQCQKELRFYITFYN